jgi:hypothetical protein
VNLFVVGAGFTKAIFPDAPLNRDLTRVLAQAFPNSATGILENRYRSKDVEISLTRLDADIASATSRNIQRRIDLIRLRRQIEDELASYFSRFVVSDDVFFRAGWLKRFLQSAFAPGDVVINLNYDCTLEGALDSLKKWSPVDGYGSSISHGLINSSHGATSPVTLLKIHGSANFVIAPIFNKRSSESASFLFNPHFFPRSAKHTNFRYGAGTGRPFLIAPSYVKPPTVQLCYLMLDALKAAGRAGRLVIIGSSLRPEDSFLSLVMTNFLRQRNWRTRRVVIVDPRAPSIRERIRNFWGVNVDEQVVAIAKPIEQSVDCLLRTLSRIKEPTRLRAKTSAQPAHAPDRRKRSLRSPRPKGLGSR